MSTQSDIASAHQKARIRLGDQLAARLMGMWRMVPLQDLDAGWDVVAPRMVKQVSNAQAVAVGQATSFVSAMDRSYKYTPPPTVLNVDALTGVMGDGREVAPALFGAVTNTKTLIGGGAQPARAFEQSAHFLAVLAQAALQDIGRNADRALAGGKQYTRYIRMVNGQACSRCAILAGIYTSRDTFLRHVSCQCTSVPVLEGGKTPGGFHTDPKAYFDSLGKAEQNRVFTNAGAEAIRGGADPVAVVNARRGAYGIGYSGHSTVPNPARSTLHPVTIGRKADGSPLQVYATVEGTSARGAFGKSQALRTTKSVRLMPETIVKMAGDNPERLRELLTKYGYIN